MAVAQGWQKYNEKAPFGKGATVITSDNGTASRQRIDAARAIQAGKATPEQHKLIADADAAISQALNAE